MSGDNYFSRRWHGQVPLPVLLWQDMLGVGTLVNLTASLLAFAALIKDAPTLVVVALQMAPLPCNVFLFGAVWRSPGRRPFARALAAVWFAVMLLI
jgi:cytochrome bd-type quinol oxidase subunit 1